MSRFDRKAAASRLALRLEQHLVEHEISQKELVGLIFPEAVTTKEVDKARRRISSWIGDERVFPSLKCHRRIIDILGLTDREWEELKNPPTVERQNTQRPKSTSVEPRYKTIPQSLEVALRFLTIKLGQPFSWQIFGTSLSLSQLYSVLSIIVVWIFVPTADDIGNLDFVPPWPLMYRLALSAWGILLIVLLFRELTVSQKHGMGAYLFDSMFKHVIQFQWMLIPICIGTIAVCLWIDLSISSLSYFVVAVGLSYNLFLTTGLFTLFIIVSILSFYLMSLMLPMDAYTFRIAVAITLSAHAASMTAVNFMRFFPRRYFIFLAISSALAVLSLILETYLTADLRVAVFFVPPLVFCAYFLTSVFQSQNDFSLSPAQALGFVILPFAWLLAISWPPTSNSYDLSSFWLVFFVALPICNALADYVSLSFTLTSWRYLGNLLSGRVKNTPDRLHEAFAQTVSKALRTMRIAPVGGMPLSAGIAIIVLEALVILIVALLLLLLVFFSFELIDRAIGGQFNAELAFSQFMEKPMTDGSWIIFMLATVFVPTIVSSIVITLLITKSPKAKDDLFEEMQEEGSIEQKVELYKLQNAWQAMIFKRQNIRLQLGFWAVLLVMLVDAKYLAFFGQGVLSLFGAVFYR